MNSKQEGAILQLSRVLLNGAVAFRGFMLLYHKGTQDKFNKNLTSLPDLHQKLAFIQKLVPHSTYVREFLGTVLSSFSMMSIYNKNLSGLLFVLKILGIFTYTGICDNELLETTQVEKKKTRNRLYLNLVVILGLLLVLLKSK